MMEGGGKTVGSNNGSGPSTQNGNSDKPLLKEGDDRDKLSATADIINRAA